WTSGRLGPARGAGREDAKSGGAGGADWTAPAEIDAALAEPLPGRRAGQRWRRGHRHLREKRRRPTPPRHGRAGAGACCARGWRKPRCRLPRGEPCDLAFRKARCCWALRVRKVKDGGGGNSGEENKLESRRAY
ncbi:unnamed protein product, partial [Scytosiphon promiscuus]